MAIIRSGTARIDTGFLREGTTRAGGATVTVGSGGQVNVRSSGGVSVSGVQTTPITVEQTRPTYNVQQDTFSKQQTQVQATKTLATQQATQQQQMQRMAALETQSRMQGSSLTPSYLTRSYQAEAARERIPQRPNVISANTKPIGRPELTGRKYVGGKWQEYKYKDIRPDVNRLSELAEQRSGAAKPLAQFGVGAVKGTYETLQYVKDKPLKSAAIVGGIAATTLTGGGTVVAGAVGAGLAGYAIGTKRQYLTAEEAGNIAAKSAIIGSTVKPTQAVLKASPVKLESASVIGKVKTGTKFETVAGKKVEVPVTEKYVPYRGVGLKVGETYKPLVGYVKGEGVKFGTPSLKLGKTYFDYQPVTGSQTAVFTKNIGEFIKQPSKMLVEGKTISPKLQQEFALKSIKAERELRNVETKFISEQEILKGTKNLPSQSVKNVLELSKKQGGIPYGSKPTSAQLAPEVRREVGDIDIHYFTKSETKLAKFTEQQLKAIQGTGVKARIPKEAPFSVETFSKGKWQKALELKGEGIGDSEVFIPEKAFGYELGIDKNVVDIGGFKVASLRGESARKLSAAVAVREEGALAVKHTGRFKDVPDVFRNVYTRAASTTKPTPASQELLKFSKQLGVEFKAPTTQSLPIIPRISSGSSSFVSSSSVLPSAASAFGLKLPSAQTRSPTSPRSSPISLKYVSPPSARSPISLSPTIKSPISPASLKSPISPISPKYPSIGSPSGGYRYSPPSPPSPYVPSPPSPPSLKIPEYYSPPSPPSPVSPSPFSPISPQYIVGSPSFIPPISGGGSPAGFSFRMPKFNLGIKKQMRYAPSLIGLGAKPKYVKSLKGLEFSGGEIRPLLILKGKKR